jgi:hypothetical protein
MLGETVQMETVRWVRLVAILWPIMGFAAIAFFFALFSRQMRRILERFNCGELRRFRIGPLEIEKEITRKRVRYAQKRRKRPPRD